MIFDDLRFDLKKDSHARAMKATVVVSRGLFGDDILPSYVGIIS